MWVRKTTASRVADFLHDWVMTTLAALAVVSGLTILWMILSLVPLMPPWAQGCVLAAVGVGLIGAIVGRLIDG